MKNWKRPLALFLSGAMALSLCACRNGGADGSASPGPSAGSSASADPDLSATPNISADLSQGPLEFAAGLSAGDVLLSVNGENIPADLMLYWLNYNCYAFMYQYGSYGLTIDDQTGPMLLEEAVNMCVNEALLRQQAAKLGCLPTDAQVKEAKDQRDANPDTISTFKSNYGLTDSSIEYLYLAEAYYNNMMAAVTHEPDELELKEYLDAQGVFSVKHILLMTVDQATQQPLEESVIAEKKAKAEDLLAQLQAADDMPAKFDELMRANSEDGGLATNPDGYTFDKTASLVGGFREAALELEIGGLSGIVETDYGYHIMLRQALTDEELTQQRNNFRATALEDQVGQWQQEAEITRSDALTKLDAADFYARLTAYRKALSEQKQSAAPAESGGVG